jgi:hypothetical protein
MFYRGFPIVAEPLATCATFFKDARSFDNLTVHFDASAVVALTNQRRYCFTALF